VKGRATVNATVDERGGAVFHDNRVEIERLRQPTFVAGPSLPFMVCADGTVGMTWAELVRSPLTAGSPGGRFGPVSTTLPSVHIGKDEP
jgi:hypothetical protein